MWDLQQWLEALFGHWQHWLGGAILGAGVLLAIALVRSLFGRRVTWPQSAAIFLFCFGADASYLAWHDQFALTRRPISVAKSAIGRDFPPETQASRKDAETLAIDIQAFFVSRDIGQPKPPRGTNPAAAEWKRFGQVRDRYNLETLNEFKAAFSPRLTDVLDKLNGAGIDTVEVQSVFRGLSHPNDVKDIAVRLNALSKE